jgi:acid phosphatase family membrane protein YuiD
MKNFKLIQYVLFSFAIILFQGCSDEHTINNGSTTGTGGTTGGTTTTPTSLSVSMTLKDGPATTDTDIASITAVNPGYISINVRDQNGNAAANRVVSISTTLAKVTPSTVLTDSSGNASAKMEFSTSLGADSLTVSSTIDTDTFSDSINYAVLAPPVQLGDNSGASFVSGQLEIAITTLSANGNTSIKAHLVDSTGNPFTSPVAINFSSVCADLSTPLATIDSTVVTSSGIATSSYQAQGCVGNDIITATADFGGATFTATGTLSVAAESAGSISFISASPQSITLLGGGGAGLQETSELKFQVLSASGSPLSGQSVTFSVNGTAGGMSFSPTTSTSNSNGEVITVVKSGSVPAVVNITATVDSTSISTQSTGLVISAGLPDYDSFTLSPDKHNPEAMDYNGVTVNVTAQLADVYNNPPPFGTSVFFTAEGGSIASSCNTDASGRCTVKWISGNPRPADFRATILAYTQGVESFVDNNGDGYLGNGEAISAQLPEVFRDDNENSTYDSGEFFADFDGNFSYDAADTKYNGNLCNDTTGRCSTQTTLNISRSFVIVFSESYALISATEGGTTYADSLGGGDGQNVLDISGGSKTVKYTFSDTNGQPLPVGTTIEVTTTVGRLLGTILYTQGDTSEPGNDFRYFTLEKNLSTNDSGRVEIKVTTPKGNQTVIYFEATQV